MITDTTYTLICGSSYNLRINPLIFINGLKPKDLAGAIDSIYAKLELDSMELENKIKQKVTINHTITIKQEKINT